MSYPSAKDIHSLVASYDTDIRKTVLSLYFKALTTLENRDVPDIPRSPSPALLMATLEGDASVLALFGGQGTNEAYLNELQSLYDTYTPYVAPFVEMMTREVLLPLASSSEFSFFSYGLDVISWLSGTSPHPPGTYTASVSCLIPPDRPYTTWPVFDSL